MVLLKCYAKGKGCFKMHINNELGNVSPCSLYFEVRFFTKAPVSSIRKKELQQQSLHLQSN